MAVVFGPTLTHEQNNEFQAYHNIMTPFFLIVRQQKETNVIQPAFQAAIQDRMKTGFYRVFISEYMQTLMTDKSNK